MNRSRGAAMLLFFATAGSPAVACDCAARDDELRTASTVVVAQVVALELPSLNENDPDSPARESTVEARLVVREALRGRARGALRMRQSSGGMCQATAPRLGEWLILALPDEPLAPGTVLELGFCASLLTLGTRWDGWDEGTLRVRDVLRAPSDPAFDAALRAYRRLP